MASLPNNLTQEKVILTILGLLIIGMIGLYSIMQWRQQQAADTSLPQSAALSISLGDASADQKVVVYTDPVCDKCAAYHKDVVVPLYNDRVKKGEVNLEIRPVSIVSEHSAPLNELIMCSSEQNAYLETMDYITNSLLVDDTYSEEKAISFFDDHNIEQIAHSTDMNPKKLSACLDDSRFDSKITQADTQAYAANIYSTPTTFVGDGEPVRGYSSLTYITRLIDVNRPE